MTKQEPLESLVLQLRCPRFQGDIVILGSKNTCIGYQEQGSAYLCENYCMESDVDCLYKNLMVALKEKEQK